MNRSDDPRMCLTIRLAEFDRKQYAASLLHAEWPAPANVRAFTTLRGPAGNSKSAFGPLNLGVRCGDDLSVVLQNRSDLAFYAELPSPPHWLQQVHGTHVAAFARPHPNPPPHAGEGDERAARVGGGGDATPHVAPRVDEPQADAAVTRTPGVVLAILTADCLPVLFCDAAGTEVAAAHAGWRGLAAGVLENTLAAMRTPRASIMAWLGPAIAASSYEVGEEVRDAFLARDPVAATAFSPTRAGHWLCDLYELARQRLHAAGVTRVCGGGLDTFTDPRLHSFRRDGARSGRMASLVWLQSKAVNDGLI